MNKAPWIFGSIALLTSAAAYGCGNGGTGTTSTAGTGGSAATTTSTHATSTHATTTTTTGTGGAGVGGAGVGGGTPDIACNPFTGAPCMIAAGEACDFGGAAFKCYPPPNDVAQCGMCDDQNTFCKNGTTCNGQCAAFCCTDADCGAGGKCDMTNVTAGVGVCADAVPADGGVMAACSAPATPPSAGSCYAP